MLKMFMTGDNAFGGTKEVRCGRHGRGRVRVGFNLSACRHADGILFFSSRRISSVIWTKRWQMTSFDLKTTCMRSLKKCCSQYKALLVD